MKKLFSKRNKLLVCALFFISAVYTLSAAPAKKASKKIKVNEKSFIGTWFWNKSYDPEKFVVDYITFNKDKTCDLCHIEPDWIEYDKAKYSILNDKTQGTSILIHITSVNQNSGNDWTDVDAKMYFAIDTIDDDKFIINNYKRDFSGMGMSVYDVNPLIFNDYRKVADGAKETLIGKWHFNKRGTPDATWEETWIFNSDGTMESIWSEGSDNSQYKGKYEVLKNKTGSVLYQILTEESSDGKNYTKLQTPMEFWYDYKICNENIINVNCTKNKIGGEEHIKTPPVQNYYYRDLPLVKYTYHWDKYTFDDYAPEGTDYKLLNLSKRYLFTGVPENLLSQNLEGWTEIGQKEYKAKWSLKCNRNDYDPQNGNYNHEFTLPVSLLAPDMKLPAKGETIKIKLTGTVDKSINMFWGLRYVDNNDEWNVIGEDWHNVKTSGKAGNSLSDVFEITLKDKPSTSDKDKIVFNLCYNPDTFDEVITISDFKFEILK